MSFRSVFTHKTVVVSSTPAVGREVSSSSLRSLLKRTTGASETSLFKVRNGIRLPGVFPVASGLYSLSENTGIVLEDALVFQLSSCYSVTRGRVTAHDFTFSDRLLSPKGSDLRKPAHLFIHTLQRLIWTLKDLGCISAPFKLLLNDCFFMWAQ